MPDNAPNQLNSNPNAHDYAQSSLQWMQEQLAEQGVIVSPEEALQLFEQKITYGAKGWFQQDLAAHGIDVSPDEANAIHRLQFYHRLMQRSGITYSPEET